MKKKKIIAISCVAFIALAVLAVLLYLRNGTNPFERAMRKSILIEGEISEVGLDEKLEAELKGKPAGTALDWVKKFDFSVHYDYGYDSPGSIKIPFFRKCAEYRYDSYPDSKYLKGSMYYYVFGATLSSGEKVYVYQFFDQQAYPIGYDTMGWQDTEQFERFYRKPRYKLDWKGFPRLFSVKGLSYADFADIGSGSTLEDVMAVDPVAEIHRSWYESIRKSCLDESLDEKTREQNLERYYSRTYQDYFLVDEGILCIYYKNIKSPSEQANPVVVGMKLYRDCRIGNGDSIWPDDISFCIDPADRPPRVDPPPTGEAPPDIVGELPVK